jgi:hypothetical protein
MSDFGESQPELGYLLEASDDDLGLPPSRNSLGYSHHHKHDDGKPHWGLCKNPKKSNSKERIYSANNQMGNFQNGQTPLFNWTLQDLAFQLEYQGKESKGIWGNHMENKEFFWEKEKSNTQKKPKSKKSAGLIFILLICFLIFLCLFVHELVNKLGTTGMRACLTKTTREREREREREKTQSGCDRGRRRWGRRK